MSPRIPSQALDPSTPEKSKKKKRKRDPIAASHPNPEPPRTLNVKMEVIYDRADRTPPIVGYFPSRYDPLAPGAVPSVTLYRNAQRVKIEEKRKGSERMELVVRPNTGANVEFVGTSYRGEAATAQLCTYALGVLDKENGSLKIVPIAGNKIFRLEPKVCRLDVSEPSNPTNVEISGQETARKRVELNMMYGSKKSVTRDKKAAALNLGNNTESLEVLEMKIDNADVDKEALESARAQTTRNIPPYNSSATIPQEAYPLDRIIFTGEWDFLGDVYQILQSGSEVLVNAYPTFVCNRVHKLKDIQDEVEQKTVSCIFSYITHLIKFKDKFSLEGASSAKNHRFPPILSQKFQGMFTPESKRLSQEKENLLISYVLVLTLYADDFRTNPADIAKDLRKSPVVLHAHFENLGCKFKRDNKMTLATLEVPLKFPEVRQRRRRR